MKQPTSDLSGLWHGVHPSEKHWGRTVGRGVTPRGLSKTSVTLENDQLTNVPGMVTTRLMPQSATMFQFRGAPIEFVATGNGEVTHLVVHTVEGAFKGARIK